MRILLASVGRLRGGPERELTDRYLGRARALAPSLGIAGVDEREIAEAGDARAPDRMRKEAARLQEVVARATVVAFDERGEPWSSPRFAEFVRREQESVTAVLALVVGGPDGLDATFRDEAARRLSLGAMTWPHPLAKLLVAEQVYRALTIIAGHPYHRA